MIDLGFYDPRIWLLLFLASLIVGLAAIGLERRRQIGAYIRSRSCLVWMRKKVLPKSPIFGERIRPSGKLWSDFPEWVLPPTFSAVPKPIGIILIVGWAIAFLIPFMIFRAYDSIWSLTIGFRKHIEQQIKEDGDPRPETLFRNAKIGHKTVAGGKKGGNSELRRNAVAQRNAEIRSEARKLLSSGKAFHDLAGIMVRRFGNSPGYPTTTTQYRNILKPLKDEVELK